MEKSEFEWRNVSKLKSLFGISGLSGFPLRDYDRSFFFSIVFIKFLEKEVLSEPLMEKFELANTKKFDFEYLNVVFDNIFGIFGPSPTRSQKIIRIKSSVLCSEK